MNSGNFSSMLWRSCPCRQAQPYMKIPSFNIPSSTCLPQNKAMVLKRRKPIIDELSTDSEHISPHRHSPRWAGLVAMCYVHSLLLKSICTNNCFGFEETFHERMLHSYCYCVSTTCTSNTVTLHRGKNRAQFNTRKEEIVRPLYSKYGLS